MNGRAYAKKIAIDPHVPSTVLHNKEGEGWCGTLCM